MKKIAFTIDMNNSKSPLEQDLCRNTLTSNEIENPEGTSLP